ncbi:alcohol dehydrogenase catalytic domain-containing protein [Saccharothrix deserti]|uniref:alcohol dehydrogenase catalytic domain-containing protein n=1 Tax=Saccharothrix deserti TaxID=2593674 RepID=UPI00131C1242|nr:alcohol dehydrogenase catalytic domain-containing protein [Saccharothrix deserti]
MPEFPSTYLTTALVNGKVSVTAQPFPHESLSEDTVVIKPDFMGICRADTKEIVGSRDIPTDRGPLFGHEFIGSVTFAGARTGFHQGDLVTFNPNITPTRTTGFAEYVFVHGTADRLDQAVIRVPEQDVLDNIWMPEPLACIVHATRKLLELTGFPSFEGKRVGIIGAGCSGLMFAMHAKHLDASVVVFNRGGMRRDFAQAQEILTGEEILPLAEAQAHRDTFDVVIVVPTIVTTDLLETAAAMAVSGGVLHIYGGTRSTDRFPGTQVNVDTIRRGERIEPVTYQEKPLAVSGAYGCFKEDYEEAFRLHADHPTDFPVERLVSRHITLDEFPEIITDIAENTKDFPGKVIVGIGAREPELGRFTRSRSGSR